MDHKNKNSRRLVICSFCGKSAQQVETMVTGPDVSICDECVALAEKIVSRDKTRKPFKHLESVPTPQALKAELDKFVIGQEHAKTTIAVAVYNHYKRIQHTPNPDEVIWKKAMCC